MSRSLFLKERKNDTCPVLWTFSHIDRRAVGLKKDAKQKTLDGQPFEVSKDLCRYCFFRSQMWIDSEGNMTVQCNAKIDLEEVEDDG